MIIRKGILYSAVFRAKATTFFRPIIVMILLSGDSGLAAQRTTPELPPVIAPIKAPFKMPQIERPSFPDQIFDIREYGAVQCKWAAENTHKSTKAIHKAIAACHTHGGGKVLIPPGDWITGAIHLKSNVNLYLAKGAIVHFSNDLEDYLPVVHVRCEGVEAYNYSPLIYAPFVENMAITGQGILHGHGRWWWQWAKNNDKGNRVDASKLPLEERRYAKGGGREGMRPTFIVPWKAKNILIEGITLEESPMWNVHPVYSENIIVRGITVHSLESPNGDGIVPDSCKNVLIEYNHLETGDDAVVIKSGLNEDGLKIGMPSENIVVRNFTARDVRTGSGGIVFGSETSGGIRNVYVHNAIFDGCDRGIRFKTTRGRGNVIENIFIENVDMRNIEAQAINFNSYYERDATGKSPLFRNITIDNVRVNGARTAIEMIGLPEKWLENIRISHVVFENVENGAIAHRVKELTLADVSISSKRRPITLNDVFEVSLKNINLSGLPPHLVIDGSESGAITIKGLNPAQVECTKNVGPNALKVDKSNGDEP